jgi:hypothetical protein
VFENAFSFVVYILIKDKRASERICGKKLAQSTQNSFEVFFTIPFYTTLIGLSPSTCCYFLFSFYTTF